MEKCLILGASGFIGKSLVKKIAANYIVIAYSNIETREFDNLDNITQIIGNFKTENWDTMLDGIDVVFHLISTTIPVDNTDKIIAEIEDNIVSTVRFLEALKDHPIKKFVFISSGGTVYGNSHTSPLDENLSLCPISSYGVQKQVIESYINFYSRKYKLPCCIARVSNPYGFGSDLAKPQGVVPIFLNKVLNNETITIWGDGSVIRDYIYMDDLVCAISKLAEHTGETIVFNVGSGKGYSINDILSLISKVTGHVCNVEYTSPRGSDVKENVLSIKRMNDELNWYPEIDLEEGICKLYTQVNKN